MFKKCFSLIYLYNHIFDINVIVVLLEDQGLHEEVFLNEKNKLFSNLYKH